MVYVRVFIFVNDPRFLRYVYYKLFVLLQVGLLATLGNFNVSGKYSHS